MDYDGETPQGWRSRSRRWRRACTTTSSGRDLMSLLPAGGARNALDCALWDLRAKQTGIAAWRQAGLNGRPSR